MISREWLREVAPALLIVAVIGLFWTFGYNGTWHRLQIDTEGTTTARQDFPQTITTHGPTTLYMLRQGDGSIREYTATPNDPSLPRTLPIGAHVTKRNGELFYSLNGARIDDFPLTAYVGFLGLGLVCMIAAGIALTRSQWYRLLFKTYR